VWCAKVAIVAVLTVLTIVLFSPLVAVKVFREIGL